MRKLHLLLQAIAVTIFFTTTPSYAEIILHGTRVIYPSNAKEVSLQLSNDGTRPALVQAWLDEGDPQSTPDQIKLPFIITPPVSRVEPTKGQTLRISALPNSNQLNQNQESMYWLNVLDIPPRPNPSTTATDVPDNFLQLAIRSRIKFIYRPASIKQDINIAPEKLEWHQVGTTLIVKNPTPFFITITSVFDNIDQQRKDLTPKGLMLSPFSEQNITLQAATPLRKPGFTTINDYGGRIEQTIKLN